MSGLWGIHPAAAAAGAAAVGAGVTHAYHSSGASKSRRKNTNQATFVDNSHSAKRHLFGAKGGAGRASSTSSATDTRTSAHSATASFPLASRAAQRGVLYDKNGDPVVIDDDAKFGAKTLFLTSLVSSVVAVAVTRALESRNKTNNDDTIHDVPSEASHEVTQNARTKQGQAPTGETGSNLHTKPPSYPSTVGLNGRASSIADALKDRNTKTDIRELRQLMEESPCESPVDSDFDHDSWMGSVEGSLFATPAREALVALRETQRAAAEAGAPFPEETVREMEELIKVASQSASACASGVNTPVNSKLVLPKMKHLENLDTKEQLAEQREQPVGVKQTDRLGEAPSLSKLDMARLARKGSLKENDAQSSMAPGTPSPNAAPLSKLDAARALRRAGSVGGERNETEDDDSNEKENYSKENQLERRTGTETSVSAATDAARDRVAKAEERYKLAQARLQKASSAASKSRASSAMHTPRGGIGDENENFGEKPSASGEIADLAQQVTANLDLARAAQDRITDTVNSVTKDTREAQAKAREEYEMRRQSQSPRQMESPRESQKPQKTAVDPKRWASTDEVKGKTDVFDRFMESLTDIRNSSVETEETMHFLSLTPGKEQHAPQLEKSMDRSNSNNVSFSAPKHGTIQVALLGDPTEGSTLMLEVDSESLKKLGVGPVSSFRWQRGAVDDAPSTPRSSSMPPPFKTIPGACCRAYTVTKADVGCVVRAVAAAGDANTGENVFGSAETEVAVAAREW